MRMMLGLDRPSSGSVLVNGKRYAEHAAPLHEVGALLEARAVHPGRSARNHLLSLALTSVISGGQGGLRSEPVEGGDIDEVPGAADRQKR
jgi:ABC-type multidrug transport system ATPase subunit